MKTRGAAILAMYSESEKYCWRSAGKRDENERGQLEKKKTRSKLLKTPNLFDPVRLSLIYLSVAQQMSVNIALDLRVSH